MTCTRSRATRLLAVATIATTLGRVSPSLADSTSDTAAQALFDEAKGLMRSGDYASACPKLEESLRLQASGGTLLFLGLCREGEGKTATAWTRFNEAVSAARRDGRVDREHSAQDHIATLLPKLTKLDVVVPEETRSLPGLELRRDGELLPLALAGTPIPVDPGNHTVRATAPGMKAWESVVATAGEGATATVTVPALERDPTAVVAIAPVPLAPPPVPPPAAPPVADMGASDAGSTQRTIALLVGGAGVVGLGIGTYFGVTALSKKSDATAQCPNGSTGLCNGGAVPLSQDAVNDGNIASVALGVGAAAVIGAGVLWLTAPKARATTTAWRVEPLAGRGTASVAVRGGW